jgi:hypothetical protein
LPSDSILKLCTDSAPLPIYLLCFLFHWSIPRSRLIYSPIIETSVSIWSFIPRLACAPSPSSFQFLATSSCLFESVGDTTSRSINGSSKNPAANSSLPLFCSSG